MHNLRSTLRLWWQRPSRASDNEEDRSVSFLELFYDLIYVVIIAELTHALVGHVTAVNVLGFIGLFALVWWAWVNGTYYHEMHSNNDIRTRILTFAQMFALAGMAVFAHNALGDGYVGFAISYTVFLTILTVLWWRTGVHDPDHRPLSQPYTIGFLVTTIIFFVSIFLPTPTAWYFWIGATVFSLLLPLMLFKKQRKRHPEKLERSFRIRPSLVERFGLLTIIVLGEVVVAVVRGASHHQSISWSFVLTVGLGLFIAIGMWWVYFDYISHRLPLQKQINRLTWMYLHLPLTMSIALTGAGLLTIFENVDTILMQTDVWLLIIPVSVFLLCVMFLIPTIQVPEQNREMHRKGTKVAGVSAVLILLIGFVSMGTLWLLIAVSLLLIAPIWSAFQLWVKRLHDNLPDHHHHH